jgi:hypothetical protein
MSVSPPRVFISYSHDSAAHKQWVLSFATTLVNRGIDAVLDQWDLKPGDDLPQFMEQNLVAANYVVMVCTQRYVAKANAGEGGVGYEKMIMTSSSLSKIAANKVIPIVREKGDPSTPTFLVTKRYIDFTNNSEPDMEFALDELLRHLLNAPLYQKPKIGVSPFQPLDKARPDKASDGIREVMIAAAAAYHKSGVASFSLLGLSGCTKMHKLTLEKYLAQAVDKGLIMRDLPNARLLLTTKGRAYLEENGIIDA